MAQQIEESEQNGGNNFKWDQRSIRGDLIRETSIL